MRVLVFTSHYPAAEAPTRGTFNRELFRELGKRCELRLVGAVPWWHRRHLGGGMFFPRRERDETLEATWLSYWSIPGAWPLHGAAAHASTRLAVRAERRRFPFDLVLASWGYPDAVAAAAHAKRAGVPLVVNVLGSDVNDLARRPLLAPQIRWAFARAQRVVAVSGALGERVVKMGVPLGRVTVLRNGVDTSTFAPREQGEARRALGLPAGGRVVLYTGNFHRVKGADVLLEAMARLDRPDVRLYLVGRGPLEPALWEQAAALGLGERVRFVGPEPHHRIPSWMAAADLLCLPSRNEGCPNVVLEALASGRGVVASRVGGVPEILDEERGVLVPPGEPEALARGLRAGLDRAWDAGRQRAAVEGRGWADVAARYLEIFEDARRAQASISAG